MKTHFNAQGTGHYIPDNAECGAVSAITVNGESSYTTANLLTDDPAKVTCERCKKTQAYKDGYQ